MNEYFGTISNSIKAAGETAGFTVTFDPDAQNDLTKRLQDREGKITVPISSVVPTADSGDAAHLFDPSELDCIQTHIGPKMK